MRYRYNPDPEELSVGQRVEVGIAQDKGMNWFPAIVERVDHNGRVLLERTDGGYCPRCAAQSIRMVIQ